MNMKGGLFMEFDTKVDSNVDKPLSEEFNLINCIAENPALQCILSGTINSDIMRKVYARREELGMCTSGGRTND
jgi:hypothetical protein